MHTLPRTLKDVIALLNSTEPASEHALNFTPNKHGIRAQLIGTAPLFLRHLWNTHVAFDEELRKPECESWVQDAAEVVADLLALGIRDLYQRELEHNQSFAITTG